MLRPTIYIPSRLTKSLTLWTPSQQDALTTVANLLHLEAGTEPATRFGAGNTKLAITCRCST